MSVAGLGLQRQPAPGTGGPDPLHPHTLAVHRTGRESKWVSALRNQHSPENAARERSRVRSLRQAFHSLQAALPSVPRDTKLSKLDVLVLATNYIAYLTEILDQGGSVAEQILPSRPGGYLHPVKKWPMRSLLYCGNVGDVLSASHRPPPGWNERRTLTPPAAADDK
ncbi:transcription factor 23-like [Cololabis saira]|uniref:transcription factor 23-like n=1 Tax=Cololabis saira TaxID=129043 RepID=UPI002AD4BFA9|nr:transcription factor 23-like [Cololabis saira]